MEWCIVPLFVESCRIMAIKAASMTNCGESFGLDGWKSIVLVYWVMVQRFLVRGIDYIVMNQSGGNPV